MLIMLGLQWKSLDLLKLVILDEDIRTIRIEVVYEQRKICTET